MSDSTLVQRIQQTLRQLDIDAWLFFDHHQRDPIGYQILHLELKQMASRRWYYLIPKDGEPQSLVHRIESRILDALPGQKHIYSGWKTQQEGLGSLLFGMKRVAMQYSPGCAIPYVSMVDAGTHELIRSFGVEVVSSADLVQIFHATLSPAQIQSHLDAGRKMDALRKAAFEQVSSGLATTEWQLQTWLRTAFDREGLFTDHGPIVAVNAHAADPHYEPSEASSLPIRKGDLLLLDMWAKNKAPGSIYYDITWTGYCGTDVPSEMDNIFTIVRDARDAAFQKAKLAREQGQLLHGFEVDDAARNHIEAAGFGEYFVHRTGHSITEDVHGTGANMDNLETHDERQVLANTLFSVEPGIYLEHFGIRSEFNVLAQESTAITTGEVQQALIRL
jgi:Xaa-Pro dipeptidase